MDSWRRAAAEAPSDRGRGRGARALAGIDSVQIRRRRTRSGRCSSIPIAGQGDPGLSSALGQRCARLSRVGDARRRSRPRPLRSGRQIVRPAISHAATLQGRISGPLGVGSGIGHIRLTEYTRGTLFHTTTRRHDRESRSHRRPDARRGDARADQIVLRSLVRAPAAPTPGRGGVVCLVSDGERTDP